MDIIPQPQSMSTDECDPFGPRMTNTVARFNGLKLPSGCHRKLHLFDINYVCPYAAEDNITCFIVVGYFEGRTQCDGLCRGRF